MFDRAGGAHTLQAGAICPFPAIGISHFAIRRRFFAIAARNKESTRATELAIIALA